MINWDKELPIAITVCDAEGTILKMNDKSKKTFERPGRENLIGQNVLDCHPEPAKTKLAGMLKEPQTNAYTIEKGGIKKLIYQTPWYEEGVFKGFIELSMEIPMEMKHFVRETK
ncbi:diguanylate cyclase [Bacteroidales bacterium OttesenSCG-928-C19]|nr:diguanylate cyclase [Bacteroidales bacterium OttesenSCG-928-C19]